MDGRKFGWQRKVKLAGGAPRDFAEKFVVAEQWKLVGRGADLLLLVSNIWQFHKESGAIPANINVKIEDAVDVRFLP